MNNRPVVDCLVQSVVERIAEDVHPRQIILFGSRAAGMPRPDSDIDLLIIYEGALSKREVKLKVRRLFPRPDFSMDLFVLSPEEFQRQKNVVSTLARTASREGIVCYE